MFGTALHDHMPQSFLTDPTVWDGFVGQVWQAVLAPMHLPTDATIIEIAPGSSPKIGHGLALLGFCGTLHVVEPSTAALDIVSQHYRRLLPHATVHSYAHTLADAIAHLPRDADALIGNHIIDDMLLNASSADSHTFDWATQYSNTVAPETHSAFAQLQSQQTHAITQVSREIAEAIATLTPRHMVLSQYPSSTLHESGLGALNDCASMVLTTLKDQLSSSSIVHDCAQQLGQLPHYHNAHIGLNVLNPAHWLSCTRKI